MIVICLEGCHGCGKSSLLSHFEESGYTCLDEAFLDMPAYALHPQRGCWRDHQPKTVGS